VKLKDASAGKIDGSPGSVNDTELGNGWHKIAIQFKVTGELVHQTDVLASIGIVVAIIAEDPKDPMNADILLGQLNVYPSRIDSQPPHNAMLLWADFSGSSSNTGSDSLTGALTWEVAAAFPGLTNLDITSPEDPIPAWALQPTKEPWFPAFLYFNIYVQQHSGSGHVAGPENATWIGTSGYDGRRNTFQLTAQNIPFVVQQNLKVRFYIQGVTALGEVLAWERCVFVDV
jgi:mannosyl-glycoprotein endo-beta-N-acetylglucosaminidase